MTVLSVARPPTAKKALLIAIRHVHRKPGSSFDHLPDLRLAHRDAKMLCDFLIARGYQPDDIILMIDDKEHPKHLWPTHNNILHQIDQLISDAPEDCHFVFYFSGHGLEEDGGDRASMRTGGQDGEIVCADAKPILDYILHDHLVTPLQSVKGAKLFALFDCCHSESLLDLQRGTGPNRYSRVWKIGPGQLFIDTVTVIVNLLKLRKLCRSKRSSTLVPLRRASTGKWCSLPTSKTEQVGELSVISLSACRDGQLAHDDCARELTFTKCFLDVMGAKPDITWTELRDTLKGLVSEIRMRYEETCLQGLDSGTDVSHETWAQEPRFSTSSHTDLTRKVSL